MAHLLKNCTNIETLNLLCASPSDEGVPVGYDITFLRRIQFRNLTKLTLDNFELLDGDFLIPVSS